MSMGSDLGVWKVVGVGGVGVLIGLRRWGFFYVVGKGLCSMSGGFSLWFFKPS